MSLPQRRHAPSWLTIFTVLALVLTTLTTSTSASPDPITRENSKHLERRQQMSVGSSCTGSEGQWNCMTNSFQRCGSGLWSAAQQCAAGTQCSPSGLTYEFHVDFANGYLGAAPPTSGGVPTAAARGGLGGGGSLVNWWLLGGLGALAVRMLLL
ncbi:hypothetical protein HD806DRAFT_84997 [Xylariaceae sp. AK1471]|nr:hypothetical protein HD806DRAFT_84997 [Xylariaceae sp. AK1471]